MQPFGLPVKFIALCVPNKIWRETLSRLNLHLFPTNIQSQTRLFKEANYTLKNKIVDRVVVIGLWHEGQPEQEILDFGLEVIRVKTLLRRFKDKPVFQRFVVLRKVLTLLSILQYFIAAIVWAIRLRPKHLSCHYVGILPLCWFAARISGATLEYLPHELETQRSGLTGLKKKLETWFERRFIHKARNVVVVCDPIRDWYRDTYGLDENLFVVRNVPEQAAVQTQPVPEGDFRTRFDIPDSARVFIYQGLFGAGRGTDMLTDIFSRLDPAQSHLVLMGYGTDEAQAVIDAAVAAHVNIHYQPAVPREWIVSYSAGADIGLWIAEKVVLSYRYALPNKFFEYAHAGVPMLVSDNLEYQAGLLEGGKFGWSAPLEQLEQTFRDLSTVDLSTYRDNARAYAASATWEVDADVFRKIYQ